MQFKRTYSADARPTIVLVRWVLIVATAYLLLFSRPLAETPAPVALFVAGYLASNLLVSALYNAGRWRERYDAAVVLFDTVAVAIGLLLTPNASVDFFPVYFLVVFLVALTRRVELLVGAALFISVAHVATLSHFVPTNELIHDGYTLRIPFLLVVAWFFGYAVNAAQRRDAARQRQAEKRRTAEFVAAVIHDVKNPLAVVQSVAELLLDGDAGPLTDNQAELARRIHASASHVIGLAVNLLDASRIEAGHLLLRRSSGNLSDVVEYAAALARSASDLKGITLRVAIEARPPVSAFDSLQMERVVGNLLDNAIKYTPPGGQVTVALRSVPGELVLTVQDTGPGIPSDELSRIFEKYRRRTVSSGVQGTGLGLFIVEAIVRAHGGSVVVESAVGNGTTFTVRLPTIQPAAVPTDRPVVVTPRFGLLWN